MLLRRLPRLALALSLAAALAVTAVAEVAAQERRGGLFEFLFGGPVRRAEPQQSAPRSAVPRQERRPRRSAAPAAQSTPAAPPAEPATDKLENARTVLVVGDFMGGGLTDGLKEAYRESPGIRIVDETNGSSGFVRDDYYDWNAEIGPILEKVDPTVVVVMIGSNDRQQIVVDGKREDPRSEPWREEYLKRVTSFAETIREDGTPLIWTGLPPFKSSSMTSDMLAFNDLHKQVVEQAGGEFVDIWEGFVDENGNFVFHGPDINGQQVRLRASDGINLSSAAKRKIAFYVEKPLKKLLGDAVSPGIEELDDSPLPELVLTPSGEPALDRTMPISLTDPELDGGSELLGAGQISSQGDFRPVSERLAEEGLAPAPPPGRADHFSLKKPSAPDEPEEADDQTTTAIGE